MHRYSAAGGSTSVGNSQGGGGGVPREVRGADSAYSASASFGLAPRRAGQLLPYKLKCDREVLSARYGPPDFYPPAPHYPEEILNRDCCVNGYKELIDGIEEANEVKLSLTSPSCNNLWTKQSVGRYKDAIRKRFRVLNNALIRKRKAGQIYGVPLSGNLVTKPGLYPELQQLTEDNRRKWFEDLSQRKRLRTLAEHVPYGFRRRAIFETLIKHDIPMLRSTWFVKIVYLNQVRPMSIGMSAGGPDKSQAKRTEIWTKDVLDYAQSVLEDVCPAASTVSRSLAASSMLSGSQQQAAEIGRGVAEAFELNGKAKWKYMVRLVHWHNSEGLIDRGQVVEWVLKQLQDRESVEALEMLLPVVLKLVDEISMSQTHVRVVADTALRWLRELCPSGSPPQFFDRPHLKYITVTLTELVRYLLLTVPDSFVALDCFPLPSFVCPELPKNNSMPCLLSSRDREISDTRFVKRGSESGEEKRSAGKEDTLKVSFASGFPSDRELIIQDTVERIQKRAGALAKAVNPGLLRNNEGKVVQGLDNALMVGDIQGACNCVFGEDFCSSDQLPDDWQADVVPGFGRTPSLLRSVDSSEVFAIRFLCEWAVCEFRGSRGVPSAGDKKPAAVKDMSRVYMAVSVLQRRMDDLDQRKPNSTLPNGGGVMVDSRLANGDSAAPFASNVKRDQGRDDSAANVLKTWRSRTPEHVTRKSGRGIFTSAGPWHDLIVAWLDQHELPKGESFERLQLLLSELVRVGLFSTDAYVRQLLYSGVLDKKKTVADLVRAARHKLLLQHLPVLAQPEGSVESVREAARLTRNERHLALHGYNTKKMKVADVRVGGASVVGQQQSENTVSHVEESMNNGPEHPLAFGTPESRMVGAKKERKLKLRLAEVKEAVASYLGFPDTCLSLLETDSRVKSSKRTKRRPISPGTGAEGTPGCEECSKSLRMKTNDGKVWNAQVQAPDDEDMWWLRKGQKVLDAMKVEPPIKVSNKQSSRGRPKTVRKTQSLAQLAAPRSEGIHGASSSSQAVDAKLHCPHHRSTPDGLNCTPQIRDGTKLRSDSSRAIGAAITSLRFNERRSLSSWLDKAVRDLLSAGRKKSSNSLSSVAPGTLAAVPLAGDGGGSVRWKVNDEQLAMIVYIMDIAHDYHTLVHLLLWLLPMAPMPSPLAHSHGGRVVSSPAWNRDTFVCEVGEATLLSYLRRYEGVLTAMDLLPQALQAGMQRAASLVAAVTVGRAGCSSLLCYVCDLLKKYGSLERVHSWERQWKMTCDQRLSAELDAMKGSDSENVFGFSNTFVSSGVGDDRDDPTLQRLTGRLARVGVNMKEIVQRGIADAVSQMLNKEKDVSGPRDRSLDRSEEGHHAAQRVVGGLMEAIRQNGSGAPQGDAALVGAAVSYLVASAGNTVSNVFETVSGTISSHAGMSGSGAASLKCARQVLQMHVLCLRLLKEALGDRHSRMIEVALATEAGSQITQALLQPAGRIPRIPFRASPEPPENPAFANEFGGGANLLGKTYILTAALLSLVAIVAVQGMTSLEKMVTVLKLKEHLEALQSSKTCGPNVSGISRSGTVSVGLKEHVAEAQIYWFRVLIGDCRTVIGGLVAEFIGEANVLGLCRMQRLIPLTTMFAPAYALFATALRRPPTAYLSSAIRDDPVLLAAIGAVNDIVGHEPFRDVCLRDTKALYGLLSSDSRDTEYADMLDNQGLDVYSKVAAMVPLRARLFLRSLLDRGLPTCLLPDVEVWSEGQVDGKGRFTDEPRQIEQLVQVLDDLQPATYHWQWVELRLLLNEQVLIEKLEVPTMSAADAVHATIVASDTRQLFECEKTFTEIVLTRLLVRPDAAALYSEAVHSLGRALEEYLIKHVKWVLEGNDMLLGRKPLHQLLDNMASRQGFSIEPKPVRLWGWRPARHVRDAQMALDNEGMSNLEVTSPEECELAEGDAHSGEGIRSGSGKGVRSSYQFATEKALADLVLPCLARSPNDTCNSFAFDLIKQMSNLEQQISPVARSSVKSAPASSIGGDALGVKGAGLRRGARAALESGSPVIGRKSAAPPSDSSWLSASALQTSMWLRLQFLLPLLPIIHTDREQTTRNMRQTLAPVLLRLLGTSVVQESVDSLHSVTVRRELDIRAEASSIAATTAAGEGLFDRLLSVLHALLSSTWAVWLKPRPTLKGQSKPLREVPPFDRDGVEKMQTELEHMQLPQAVRARIRAALPLLTPSPSLSVSAGPPQISPSALALIQPVGTSIPVLSSHVPSGAVHPKPAMAMENTAGKPKAGLLPEPELEVDPWTILEDGVGRGSGPGSWGLGPGEGGNMKACSWLKGAVRVRRSDLTYVGAVDEDS